MTLHPEVVKRAQDEIDRVVGNARLPDFDDRSTLPYVENVLTEVYRCVICIRFWVTSKTSLDGTRRSTSVGLHSDYDLDCPQ